jgi:hypothetical protein
MPVCDALTNKGCHNPGRFILEALVSGNVARKSLTDDLVGGHWTTMELHVCKLHLGILNRGKAINLKAGVNTLTSYTLTNPEELNLFTAEVLSTPTKEEIPMNATEKIVCGHCKGRHATPAEVAACYGVERKPSRGPAPLIIKEHPNSKSQWFASKKDAIKFLKGLGDISKGMNPANNGNGVWAWWKTNNS